MYRTSKSFHIYIFLVSSLAIPLLNAAAAASTLLSQQPAQFLNACLICALSHPTPRDVTAPSQTHFDPSRVSTAYKHAAKPRVQARSRSSYQHHKGSGRRR